MHFHVSLPTLQPDAVFLVCVILQIYKVGDGNAYGPAGYGQCILVLPCTALKAHLQHLLM